MQFGLFGSAQADSNALGPETGQGFRDYIEYCVEAEALGLRSSFLVEHHFTGWNQVSATLMLQACVAMRTTRLRLGTAVMVLPWHNPVLLAEQAATLDLVSGGRLDLGIGKGYRHSEFHGFGIAPDEAEARFDEAVEVMVRSWVTRERFSHQGRFWKYDDIVVEPPPAQRPHPPLWVAAGSAASIRRAAERGFNLILDQYASPAVIGERIALYRSVLAEQGKPFDPMQVAVARRLYVAKDRADRDAAMERQAEANRRTLAVSQAPDRKGGSHILSYAASDQGTEAHSLYGTPDELAPMLEDLHKAGVAYVILTIAGNKEQLRRFARDVMPAAAKLSAQESN
jgi:alkanesulfonate monooxygenase SsuD/methylene tetrahydromethanopterin reductase-like flavin-dependent oxidoreductase (luciferase family)